MKIDSVLQFATYFLIGCLFCLFVEFCVRPKYEFEHEYPTEEELIKAMRDILGGTDKGTIIFMQKLYVEDPFAEVIDMGTVLGSAVENLTPNGLRDAIGLGEVKTDAEQQ